MLANCYSCLTPSVSMCVCMRVLEGVKVLAADAVLRQITAECVKADSCKGLLMKRVRGDNTVTSDEPNLIEFRGRAADPERSPDDNRMQGFIVECFCGKWKDETNWTDSKLSFMSILLFQQK